MGAKKYERYIRTDLNTQRDEIGTRLFTLDADSFNGIPIFADTAWVWPNPNPIVMEGESHSHPFDEIITLFGTDPDNPQDLCGEVEFWLGGEKYEIVKSCVIYVPKGISHCPLIFKRVDRPIFHFIVGNAAKYAT